MGLISTVPLNHSMSWHLIYLVRYLREFIGILFVFSLPFHTIYRIDSVYFLSDFANIFQNTGNEQMEMTTPVYTRKVESSGEKMDMTTPVITRRVCPSFQ